MLPFLPALLAALSGVWCGTFSGGASWAGSAVAALLPLGLGIAAGSGTWAGGEAFDPLRLGRAGRLLPAALWIAVAASAWASPVPRAGRFALVLLPAYLALPGAVAGCWPAELARRRGLRVLAGAVGGVALFSLAGIVFLHTGRAALPLGHHNLLAAWLVILLPSVLLPARETGGWRWLGWASGFAGVAAVLASRSFLGIVALAVEGLVLLALERRRGRLRGGALLLLILLLLGGGLLGRRAWRIVSGADPSARARAVYYEGGWEGFRARPILGWGAGSAAWTASRFLRPRPGVNPASEVVGELHSLPVELGYELGITGLLLAASLAALFLFRRRAELATATDRPLLVAGLLGLLGAAVASLGSAALAVTALPLAAALAAGMALAGGGPEPAGRRSRGPAVLYAGVSLLFLISPLLAGYHYARAIAAPAPQPSRDHLARAVELDPAFPLYRARLGWLEAGLPGGREQGAEQALRAAEDSGGVAPLWLAAGVLGLGAEKPWAAKALREACVRDPLAPFAPYFLAVAAPRAAGSPFQAAHAFLAEPRLLAATFWDDHRPLLAVALAEVRARSGIEPGWREALAAAAGRLPPKSADDRAWLALEVDETPSLALSLYAFRRSPWPLEWPLVEVRPAALAGLDLPAAATLPAAHAAAFRCQP